MPQLFGRMYKPTTGNTGVVMEGGIITVTGADTAAIVFANTYSTRPSVVVLPNKEVNASIIDATWNTTGCTIQFSAAFTGSFAWLAGEV